MNRIIHNLLEGMPLLSLESKVKKVIFKVQVQAHANINVYKQIFF